MHILRVSVVALVLVAACTTPAAAPGLPPGADAVVSDVVDGDTLRMVGAERVRLLGIDAPESARPVECFGKEASERLESLLPKGTRIRLVGDVEPRDHYGRLLGYVYRVSDALFVNATMVREGYAQPLTIPPNVAHAEELLALAREAREGGRGLWAACLDPGRTRGAGRGSRAHARSPPALRSRLPQRHADKRGLARDGRRHTGAPQEGVA